MTREERRARLNYELSLFFDTHQDETGWGESYKFEIGMHIDVPAAARRRYSKQEIQERVDAHLQDQVHVLKLDLEEEYPWIHRMTTVGRGGWWLVIEPETALYNEDWVSLSDLRARIADLREIRGLVEDFQSAARRTLESPAFWGVEARKQDWNPRRPD